MNDGSARQAASLELQGISKSFGEVRALTGVSLAVRPGEFLTLLGASGSGKSTTLLVIAGFQKPDTGRVFINGRDLTGTAPYARDIGLVFQHYALFPHLSVEQNIAFPLQMRKHPKPDIARRIGAALRLVRLEGFGRRMPDELSGGQQQRVALARALVFEPPILLLDEPLGALDKNLREEMQHEIRAIQQQLGITTISVTHDQQEALTMSDRIVVMREGGIAQVGTPTEVYERPANRFVAEFMGASNVISATIAARLVRNGPPVSPDAGRAVVVRPERIKLAKAGSGEPAGLPGRVRTATYVGDQWRLKIVLSSGAELLVTSINTGTRPFEIDEDIELSCSDDDVWPIPS